MELPVWAGGKKKEATQLEHVKAKMNKARASWNNKAAKVGESDAVQGIQQATGMTKNESLCPKLTYEQRLYGCVGCFCVGVVLSIAGWVMWQSAAWPCSACACQRASHS